MSIDYSHVQFSIRLMIDGEICKILEFIGNDYVGGKHDCKCAKLTCKGAVAGAGVNGHTLSSGSPAAVVLLSVENREMHIVRCMLDLMFPATRYIDLR